MRNALKYSIFLQNNFPHNCLHYSYHHIIHLHLLTFSPHYALTPSTSTTRTNTITTTTTNHQHHLEFHQSTASYHLPINGLRLALNSIPPSKYIPTATSVKSKLRLFYPLAVKRKSEFILFSQRLNEYPDHC